MTHAAKHPAPPRLRARLPLGVWLLPLVLASGCVAGKFTDVAAGQAGQGGQTAANANDDTMTGVAMEAASHLPSANACATQKPAPRGLRRLTLAELNSTLQDLFADPNAPQAVSLFTGDARVYGFDNVQTSLAVRDNQAMALSSFAETVGTYAGAKGALLAGCETTEAACRQAFIASFGRKAFRRPLSAAEVAAYGTLMTASATTADGVGALVTAMLQSPYFLYRSELGVLDVASGQYVLTPFEVATELSYMLTGTMPDAALAMAADANALDAAGVQAQGERLLASPKAHAAIDRFFLEWLQVDDLGLQARSEGTTVLSPAIKAAMRLETQAFVDDTVFAQKGSFADMMGRDVTFVSADLAQFYTGSATTTPALPASTAFGLAAVQASAMGRQKGVLGQGGVLTAASQPTYASPTLRGRMLRMRMLCGSVAPPPPGIPPLPAGGGTQTLRQRFEAHTKGTSCASCHVQMDPLAFPLGGYDTLGRARAGGTEDGLPIDVSGAVFTASGTKAVAGPAELIAELAQSPEAAACLARHWTMYAMGRLAWPEDSCTFDAVAQGAAAQKNNVQGMLLALTHAKSFTVRVKDL